MPIAEKIYVKNPDFIARQVADEFILIPVRNHLNSSKHLYVLNPTGATFWRSLDGKQSVSSIVHELSNEFDVTEEQLGKDLAVLIEDLLSIQAVEEVSHDHR